MQRSSLRVWPVCSLPVRLARNIACTPSSFSSTGVCACVNGQSAAYTEDWHSSGGGQYTEDWRAASKSPSDGANQSEGRKAVSESYGPKAVSESRWSTDQAAAPALTTSLPDSISSMDMAAAAASVASVVPESTTDHQVAYPPSLPCFPRLVLSLSPTTRSALPSQ